VGDEVPHAHVHVVPITEPAKLSFASVDSNPSDTALAEAADVIRERLRAMGRERGRRTEPLPVGTQPGARRAAFGRCGVRMPTRTDRDRRRGPSARRHLALDLAEMALGKR